MAKKQPLEMAMGQRPARTTLIEAAIAFRELMGLKGWLSWLRHQTIEAESLLRHRYQEDPGGPLAIDERRELNAAREKLKLAEEALDFYAAPDNWLPVGRKPSPVLQDAGDVAKEAMRKLADDTDEDENSGDGEGGE